MNSALKLEETLWRHSEAGELDSNLNFVTCLLCDLDQGRMHFVSREVKNRASPGGKIIIRKSVFINFKLLYKCQHFTQDIFIIHWME